MLNNSIRIQILDTEMILLPHKAIYFVKEKILLVSDLHIGKAGHFRDAGIPVPADLAFIDLQTLDKIFLELDVEKLIVLGDLFHSKLNFDWRILSEWRANHNLLQVELVKGNHDILQDSVYKELNIDTFNAIVFNKFLFIHNFNHAVDADGLYKFCGHIHPAVRLYGKGRQAATLPCYYFGNTTAVLPSFGRFTGKYIISPKENDKVFVIMGRENDKKVMRV